MKVFIIAAISSDGFIAKDLNVPSTAWTSSADKKHFGEITKRAGVIVMGSKTYETIGKVLPGRKTIVYSNTPINSPDIETATLPPAELIAKLEKEGFKELAVCGGGTIYTMFIKAGLIDTIYLTLEPVIFGTGVKLFNENLDCKLKLLHQEKRGDSLFLEYQVLKS